LEKQKKLKMKNFIFPSNSRLCIHFPTLIPSINQKQIDKYLDKKGFGKITVDIIDLARKQLGVKYMRGSMPSNKTKSFDCSSLTQWLYGQKGIYIPRISIDQRDFGNSINIEELKPGDLVFTNGHINYYWENDKMNSVGHVGLYTGTSVIHAANKKRGVVEDDLSTFLDDDFRGATRIYDYLDVADTILIPEKERVEYDIHLRWRILRSVH